MEKMVQELLEKHGVTEPEQFNDWVYLVGEWYRDTRRNMKMCRVTGLVRLHDQVKGHPFVDELPTVAELRTGNRFPEMLLSVHALALININGEVFVPLLQRDMEAKFDPGAWTLPAGRLDQSSFTLCAIKEFLEEFRLIGQHKHLLPSNPCMPKKQGMQIFQNSLETVAKTHAASHAHLQEHELVKLELLPIPGQQKVQLIRDDLMSRADDGLLVLDGTNNTMEMVIPMKLNLTELPMVFDGERFGRKAELVPITTLLEPGWTNQNPTVPTLHRLISQHAELLKQLANS